MGKQELKAFILDFYNAWEQRDKEKIRSFYADDVEAYADYTRITLHDIFSRIEDGFKKFAKSYYDIRDIFADEEQGKVCVRMNQRHIMSDGSEDKEWDAISTYEVKDNKIVSLWMSYNPPVHYKSKI